jgi:phosphatidylethanolamine-binding protein (PEBP) family uncharacterized protein
LAWSLDDLDDRVQETILIVEDADAPFQHRRLCGMFAHVPPSRSSVRPDDFDIIVENERRRVIRAGFTVGENRTGQVYLPPRPWPGHGPHRCFFQVVALKERLDRKEVGESPTAAQLRAMVDGKVAGWGAWVGVCVDDGMGAG